MNKRILSLATAIALIGSTLVAPITANAAATTTTLIAEDFADATLEDGIEYTADVKISDEHSLNNTWTIADSKLKLEMKSVASYDEEHPMKKDDASNISAAHPVSLKIPFDGVTAGDKLTIKFTAGSWSESAKDLTQGMRWTDFASVYTDDDVAVVYGKRDKSRNDEYLKDDDMGRLDKFGWIGKKEENVNQTITLEKDSATDLTVDDAVWDTPAKVDVTMVIHTTTGKIDIGYKRATKDVNMTVYSGADLAAAGGGYLMFRGYLNTWVSAVEGHPKGDTDDIKIFFDTISITAERDLVPKKMPIHNEMNVADTYNTEFESKVAADRYTIIDEPGVEGNKVLAVNMEDYPTTATASNNTNMLGAVWFPYEGLGAEDNLKVSYRFKDPNKNHNLFWQHFGTITNDTTDAWNAAAGNVKDVLRCARYDYETGMFHENQEWATNLTYYGMTEATKLSGEIKNGGSAQKMVTYYAKNISDWIRVDINIERASKKATITYTNEAKNTVLATGDTYLINDLASSGALYFKGGPSFNNKSAAQTIYIDDVKISTWKALEVESTNLTETDFDAATPITLTFSDTVPDTTKIKEAISIRETVSGAEVAASRISVALDGEKKSATVTVADGLKYGKTGYTLKLTGGVIESEAGVPLTADYTKTFTTKMGPSVFVESNTALSNNSTTISINNPTGSAKSVWAVLALYGSNNELVGIGQYENAALATGVTSNILLTATVRDGLTPVTAQILLWDSNTSLVPYHIPIDVTE